MGVKQSLEKDMKEALRGKEQLRLSVIRLTLAAIRNVEKDRRRELSEEEINEILAREVKKRNESITEFRKGRREDLATKEEEELAFLRSYLPEQITPEEIRILVREVICGFPPEEQPNLGKVMQKIIPKVKGRADGKLVNEIVREELGSA
jgi:uncharacterized protein YqeY